MRQETTTTNIYSYEELSAGAKEKARDWYRSASDYPWHDESIRAIQSFCDRFNVKLKDWSMSLYHGFDYKADATNENFRGMKLKDFDRDNMPTGYSIDCDLWMTFYDAFKQTGDAKAAFDSALHEGFSAWRKDMEYHESDEAIEEALIENEYDFLESGKHY